MTPKDIPGLSLKPPQNVNSLLEITIADKDINEAIDDMAITSTPGPEGITNTIYQEYPDQLLYP